MRTRGTLRYVDFNFLTSFYLFSSTITFPSNTCDAVTVSLTLAYQSQLRPPAVGINSTTPSSMIRCNPSPLAARSCSTGSTQRVFDSTSGHSLSNLFNETLASWTPCYRRTANPGAITHYLPDFGSIRSWSPEPCVKSQSLASRMVRNFPKCKI